MRIPAIRLSLFAVSCFALASCIRTSPAEPVKEAGVADTTATTAATPDTVNLIHGIPVDSYNVVTGRVKRNQFMSTILASYNVPWNTIEELLRENREVFDPRKVRTGSSYSVFLTKDTVNRADYFIYEHDPTVSYIFSLKDTLAVFRYDAEVKKILRYSSGSI